MLRRMREHRARIHLWKGFMHPAQSPLELGVGDLVLLRITLCFVGIDAVNRHEELDAPRSTHRLGAELRGYEVRRPVI
eukprot:4062829-Prymnesium_polylepis.1